MLLLLSGILCLVILKGLAHADLAKKDFLHEFLLFYVRLLCSINFCFGLVEMWQKIVAGKPGSPGGESCAQGKTSAIGNWQSC